MNQTIGRRVHRVFTAGSVSLNIALGSGIVMSALGWPLGEAVAAGGGAFIAAMTLALVIMNALELD
ncbi:hypothetical protein ACFC0M_06595 [Streptomyces sp. NPDC056149]|uniref:hypothetical protein n=1 Tax=Streptomyces sp. NPDC056149 TaxID=3345728 RepID=UPI0035D9E98F